MKDWLLKLGGIDVHDAGHVARTAVELHGVNPGWVVLGALALGALTWWMYRRTAEQISTARRVLLTGLRGLFLFLILAILLGPVLVVTLEHAVRRTVVVLIDTSASMKEIADKRSDEADLKRVALARDVIEPDKGLAPAIPQGRGTGLAEVPRLEIARSVLKNPRLALLSRLSKDYDLSAYTFDRGLVEIPEAAYRAPAEATASNDPASVPPTLNLGWVDKLDARGPVTAEGDAIREVISRKRGQPMAGIVLIGDGASNSGGQPLDAAKLAGQDKVPLFVYGVGITSPKDIVVEDIFAQEVAFAKDEMPVSVRVRAMGLAGQSAKLKIKLGDQTQEKDVTFNADGEQVVSVTLTPKTPGEFVVEAGIAARDDEANKANNFAEPVKVRVVDGKIKVLWIEQQPRWEFQYAQAILLRDRRVDLKCVLLEGDPNIAKGENSPYLSEVPRKKEDLFKYDLIVLGDVDAKALTQATIDAIHEFVSKFGGALAVVAGKRYSPASYRQTPLEKMLPVELETIDASAGTTASRAVRLELTPAGKSNLMLRLAERDADSVARWAQMPPVYWVAPVARAKPAAEVLLLDADPAKASRFGKMPVMAMQQYGLGQVLYLGTDNLWRWRKNAGDKYHSMIWGQIAQRMSLAHLLGATKRTQLTTDKKSYVTGDKVTVYARLYSESYEPYSDETMKGTFFEAGKDNAARDVALRKVPGQPGMYRGEMVPVAGGNYVFRMAHDPAAGAKVEFAVADPKQELGETAMNVLALQQIAAASGGAFFREEDLYKLPERLGGKTEKVTSTLEVELWSSWVYFGMLLAVVTAEWIVRKVCQLK